MRRRPLDPDPAQFGLFAEPEGPLQAQAVSAEQRAAPGANPLLSQPPPVLLSQAPGLSLAEPAFSPAVFRHPQGDRDIRLNGHVVSYALRRSKRRSIGFVVGAEGLSVNAPKWVGLGDIESALREKAAWILRKLGEQQERARRLNAARITWRDGTSIPFLGEPVIVVLDPRTTGAVLNPGATEAQAQTAGTARHTLQVGLPDSASPERIRDAVQSWLQRQARRVFEERCRHFADRLGVRYSRLTLSSAQTRWGSASADGSIRLNWRLIHFGMSTIDYVVAHELAHLREMNHSPRFWDVVRSVVPDYEMVRGSLKGEVLPVFD